MQISRLELAKFRNYELLNLDLGSGRVLISGENGQGKTNLLEAIFFLANQSSHRVSSNKDLISNGAQTSVVAAKVAANGRNLLPAVEINRTEANRFYLNGNKVQKASEISGIIRSVMFSPEDIELVRGDPSARRVFLDQVLVQISPKLALLKSNYDRVLKQRNALLKSARTNGVGDASTLDIWDEQLAEFGAQLIEERLSLITLLSPLVQDLYANLSGTEESVALELKSSIWGWSEDEEDPESESVVDKSGLKTQFLGVLGESRRLEIERGITLFGPHRDDLLITLNSQSAKTQASQGEAWSIALSLKLSVAQLFRGLDMTGDPVLLLDDVFSVLDQGRRNRLMQFVEDYEQVLVTSTSNSVEAITEWDQLVSIRGGAVVEDE